MSKLYIPEALLDSLPARFGEDDPLDLLSLVGKLGEVGIDKDDWSCSLLGGSGVLFINDRRPSPLKTGRYIYNICCMIIMYMQNYVVLTNNKFWMEW